MEGDLIAQDTVELSNRNEVQIKYDGRTGYAILEYEQDGEVTVPEDSALSHHAVYINSERL